MAAVVSTMQKLGNVADDFSLPDVTSDNNPVSLADGVGQPLLIMFICNHCPYVIHIIEVLTEIANEACDKGFMVVAISSNDVIAYPQDGPKFMREFAKQHNFKFPYLYDESQNIAKAYGAACTPDFFVYSKGHRLVYRGQMDDARPGNQNPVSGAELQAGLDAAYAGLAVSGKQNPSMGCNIKWRAGNEPEYF